MTNAMAALKKEDVQCMVAPYGEWVCTSVLSEGACFISGNVRGVLGHCQPAVGRGKLFCRRRSVLPSGRL